MQTELFDPEDMDEGLDPENKKEEKESSGKPDSLLTEMQQILQKREKLKEEYNQDPIIRKNIQRNRRKRL